jgi:hypothetical protein
LVILGFVVFFADDDSRHHALGAALWSTAVVMLVVVLLLEWAGNSGKVEGRKQFGFLEAIVGADGRISTSKTVAYFWTLELAAALTFLGAVVCWGALGTKTGVEEAFGSGSNWDAYLLLLGGPFAAAVIAKGITASSANGDSTAKTYTKDASEAAITTVKVEGSAQPKDVVTNDDGSTSLADTQYTIFSLVAVAYFLGALIGNIITYAKGDAAQIGLPAIPSALLGLTSLAALTYVGNKAVATQGMRTSTLEPDTQTPGQTVTATLVNLPKDSSRQNVWITAANDGNRYTAAPDDVNASTGVVRFTVPQAPAGDYKVVIFTPDSSTPPLPLKVT